jgi:hypothetical protein
MGLGRLAELPQGQSRLEPAEPFQFVQVGGGVVGGAHLGHVPDLEVTGACWVVVVGR